MKNRLKSSLVLIIMLLNAGNILASFDWFDYYISGSLLTNFHIRNIEYDFEDISKFNYHFRFNDPDYGYMEPESIYTKFSSDRFNKAKYSLTLSLSPKNSRHFFSFEYALINGTASFPLLGGSLRSQTDYAKEDKSIYFLEKDDWNYSRRSIGFSYKHLMRDLRSFRLYFVIGIDRLNISFNTIRNLHIIHNDNINSHFISDRNTYSETGFNVFLESNYVVYGDMRIFIKIGYKLYPGKRLKIETGPDFQYSTAYFNPSSISFQFGILYHIG